MPRARLLLDHRARNPTVVCLDCWKTLCKTNTTRRRSFFTGTPHRDAALTGRYNRDAFRKEYFWANGLLEELFQGSKRRIGHTALATNARRVDRTASTSNTEDQTSTDRNEEQHAVGRISQLPTCRRRRKDLGEGTPDDNAAYPIPHDASSRLSTISSNLPTRSFRRLFTTYLSLSKPRLSFLIVLTTTSAYSLYPVPALLSPSMLDAPSLSTLTLLFLTTGTALACSSANAFNMLLEPVHDAKMSRTRNRPLVRGLISKRGALVFAVVTGVAGVAGLYYGVNPTTAFLGGLNIFLYAGIYTPMKRISVFNTWVGAIVGGIPPLMGWTAAAGQCAYAGGAWQELLFGEGSAGGWLIAALLYTWQFPHFNALSWAVREEYKNAGYRMLCWTNQAMNGRVALRYSILMFPVCAGLTAVGVTDWGFVATSSVVNSWMAWNAVKFWRYEGVKGSAISLFWASVWHLPIVLVLAMLHKKGLWEKVWRSLNGQSELGDDWQDDEEL
ncbi:heme a biosynthesis protein-like protein [Patellaria atrata CBS 101060]|uniref:Protoheme IX farnesyltransferase, mitochondrial n=1 Tax=Patellaria atrata CBS 101060 TaxID=1346257 RepID=A0A9P4S723_9PEZI|nr:heme a biosynthesis protein-like protein [Patellaria atrata CBS 101060]